MTSRIRTLVNRNALTFSWVAADLGLALAAAAKGGHVFMCLIPWVSLR